MTSQRRPPDPPRLPLRVQVSFHSERGDGSAIVATAWRILKPDQPAYEAAYLTAARAHRLYGWAMPYADRDAADTSGQGHG